MELSMIRLQDAPGGAVGERRRRIRHKTHTPAYASFNHSSSGLMVDLSELIDLHEDGLAVQTSERLQVKQAVNVSLDLPETRAILHCSGEVVWSDGAGRAGIRLSGIPDLARQLVKEWLFINLLIACSNQAARKEQAARRAPARPTEPLPPLRSPVPMPVPDLTGMLSAIEAVRREVRATGDDVDGGFRLITERALSLTGGSGAALAFLTGDKMICRAQAGEPSPPLGAAVDMKQGVSGECVRTGRMIKCDDTEIDSRVERNLCRILGISSILAAPILSDFRVVGLIEVFAPRARAFTEVHEMALDRLVEIVPKVKAETSAPAEMRSQTPSVPTAELDASLHAIREASWEPETEAQEPLKGVTVRPLHFVLLVLTAIVASLVLGYLLAPTIEKWWLRKPPATVSAASAPATPGIRANTVEALRTLAEQGDADAQWNLGVRYHTGDGLVQDDSQAVQWFLRAAEQGHVSAQATLGAYYWAGRGVPQDLSKAYFWSVLALAQGDDGSKSRLEGLALQMTRAQVAGARQQAEEWLRQHHARPDAKQ